MAKAQSPTPFMPPIAAGRQQWRPHLCKYEIRHSPLSGLVCFRAAVVAFGDKCDVLRMAFELYNFRGTARQNAQAVPQAREPVPGTYLVRPWHEESLRNAVSIYATDLYQGVWSTQVAWAAVDWRLPGEAQVHAYADAGTVCWKAADSNRGWLDFSLKMPTFVGSDGTIHGCVQAHLRLPSDRE